VIKDEDQGNALADLRHTSSHPQRIRRSPASPATCATEPATAIFFGFSEPGHAMCQFFLKISKLNKIDKKLYKLAKII
jgi:hypothetical protein